MLPNGVADKRRPRTGMPNNINNFLFIKMFINTNYFKEQFGFTTKHKN
jgi:hypothetical protein